MIVLLRGALVAVWLAWAQVLGVLAGVSHPGLLIVPAVVLVAACLVPLVGVGARSYAVALTLTAAWLLGVATWGLVGASILLVTACVALPMIADSSFATKRQK
ncbi:hypothetical protein [Nonomuraea lactucae]|uniref:hypothetical protein n=1 Tax=Nonomuraea lactucae TaxID=2249762 RepID=UPI000DE484BB|nr:hypothetical protein [Nonomuraea lactucae]